MGLIESILSKFFGNKADRDLKELNPYLLKIQEVYPKYRELSHDELRAESQKLRQRVAQALDEDRKRLEGMRLDMENPDFSYDQKESLHAEMEKLKKHLDVKLEEVLNEILPDAFAVMKDTARRFFENRTIQVTATDFDRSLAARVDFVSIEGDKAIYRNSWVAGGNEIVWDMVHYDVQLIGGVVLHQGKIAEMATGEGKTLVATLPVFLNALAGLGVHVVTVNDYLARRDSEWMGPLYQFHGLSVDCIDKHQPNSDSRRNAYLADITFGTNNEFGFDYLRDNMSIAPSDLVQRKHHYAIVDEVDSVLIDDARTPLIISGPVPKGDIQMFDEYKPKVEKLVNAQRNLVTKLLADAKKLISEGNTEEGSKVLLRAFKGFPKYKPLIKYLSEQGIKALMHKTENFYMQENNKNMHIITDELYFVIDEKLRSVEMTEKGIDLITSSSEDAKFFILPDIGTEVAEIERLNSSPQEKLALKEGMLRDYAVKSERVHTVNQLLKAYSMFEKDVEYVVMDNKVKIVDEQTGRILEGRRYSDGLHQAIEAKERVKVEAASQTFATVTLQNYFRMYHKLAGMTGTAETEAGEFWSIYKLDVVVIPTNKPTTRKDMEDLVYKTKREKYVAVIDEIEKLIAANRPVLVGTTSVEISELLSRMLKIKGIKHNVLNAKLHQKEADIVAEAGRARTVTIATNMAGRGTDIKLSPEVKQAGGLAILGTERHESRRVDRQLRGRSGRQGDPGTSQFFVSLEDDLMRLFGSDRIARIMDRLGLKEGEVIQHSMISRSIERAQRKVEENNFGIRKRLLEYDDVMNSQREVIYTRRRNALFGERMDLDIANMLYDVCAAVIQDCHGNMEFNEFNMELIRSLALESPFGEDEFLKLPPEELTGKLYTAALENFERKNLGMARQAYPVIKEVFEKQAAQYENIVVPISDGQKIFQIVTNLRKAYDTGGKELTRTFSKTIGLYIVDDQWKEHLREMDDLKQSVQNAAYEQKDPLLIYKFEAYQLFKNMIDRMNREVISILMKAHIPLRDPSQVQAASQQRKLDMSRYETSRTDNVRPGGNTQERNREPVRVEKKVGRNDPCPCGSGKKYKACHGQ